MTWSRQPVDVHEQDRLDEFYDDFFAQVLEAQEWQDREAEKAPVPLWMRLPNLLATGVRH